MRTTRSVAQHTASGRQSRAEAPGIGSTRMPAVDRRHGSAGRPDPKPSAFRRRTPARRCRRARSRAISDARLPGFVVFVQARRRRGDRVAREQLRRPPRVFRRDDRTLRAARAAPRTVMSSRLPIGVATTNSVPDMWAAAFIVPLADLCAWTKLDRLETTCLKR